MSVRKLIIGSALALTVTVAAAQEVTPFQHQVLGGIKKTLVEYVQKQHAGCESTMDLCVIGRVDVLDNVLKDWENTPDYGSYAVTMMEWQAKLVKSIAEMAHDYVARHGHLDVGFDGELHRRMADPAFQPPKEYLCRHMFGSPHLYGSQGDICK